MAKHSQGPHRGSSPWSGRQLKTLGWAHTRGWAGCRLAGGAGGGALGNLRRASEGGVSGLLGWGLAWVGHRERTSGRREASIVNGLRAPAAGSGGGGVWPYPLIPACYEKAKVLTRRRGNRNSLLTSRWGGVGTKGKSTGMILLEDKWVLLFSACR